MTVSQKQNQKPASRQTKNIALMAAKPISPSPVHGRMTGGATAQCLRESPPVVMIPAAELIGADSIHRAACSLRSLHEAGRAGSEAALCVLDTGNALVADWVQNRIYHVELDIHQGPEVVSSTEMASSLIGTAWLQIRKSSWATPANLRDPELAAALKAAQQYVVRLGLRLQDATIGGRDVMPELAR